jgi:excisionase family DNA binding protein
MQFKPTYPQPWQSPDVVPPASASRPAPPPSLASQRPFLTVSEAAPLLRVSDMSLYRAIHASRFPAVRIGGRIIVPTVAIDEMIAAAMATSGLVDAAAWVRDHRPAS